MRQRIVGTYVLYDEHNKALYVGQSTNCERRIKSHLRRPPGGKRIHHWDIMVVPDEFSSRILEGMLSVNLPEYAPNLFEAYSEYLRKREIWGLRSDPVRVLRYISGGLPRLCMST